MYLKKLNILEMVIIQRYNMDKDNFIERNYMETIKCVIWEIGKGLCRITVNDIRYSQ